MATASSHPEPLPPALFQGRGLACVRGDRVVFSHFDFACAPGDAIVLSGRNGSGKSSLLRVMAGMVSPASGLLLWQGIPLGRHRESHALRCRYVGHADAVKPVLTVAENVSFWVRFWASDENVDEASVSSRVRAALERFSMSRLATVPGRFLSEGQKRRVNLARLLAAPGTLWLLDEPTTTLDADSIAVLETAMMDHRAAGGMVVLSAHTDVDVPAARVVHMEDFAPDPLAESEIWLGGNGAPHSALRGTW